jgi:1-acyl-sn-glycerol-3-phosphate acyltransferase
MARHHNSDEIALLADQLIQVAVQMMRELSPAGKHASRVTLGSTLERDLGMDSLGQAELLSRLEKSFVITFSGQLLGRVETLRDLLEAVLDAKGEHGQGYIMAERREHPVTVAVPPEQCATLPDILEWHCRNHPSRTHIILSSENGADETISYGELLTSSRAIASQLLSLGIKPGHTVAIMLPTSRNYFLVFFGILLAGAIPVPLYPPAKMTQIEDHLRRHHGILDNARVKMLITVPEAKEIALLLKLQVRSLATVVTADRLLAETETAELPLIAAGDTALLQYTSGSTGSPKGVVLTHANLLANIRAMGQVTGISSSDVFVSWLPLYHDMGLIGAWLGSLFFAAPLVIMSPLSFLAHPEQWLWAIHRYRGTISAAPNFAYELCLRKIPPERLDGLDLGSLKLLCNGAEAVSPLTMMQFRDQFARYGLRAEAISPVYGLAESSVGLAFPPVGRGLLIDWVNRNEFTTRGRAIKTVSEHEDAVGFVACGHPLPGHEIRIVDHNGFELPERQEGRLEFKGPSATSGYYLNPEESRRLYHGEWLDSGDLAYFAEGDLYLTGRAKDIVIKAGRNIYPQELEEAVSNLQGIRKGCVAVFGSKDLKSGTERLVVLAETRETVPEKQDLLRSQVNDVITGITASPADDIMLVPPHSVLKTSSGKIRRSACRHYYETTDGMSRPKPVWQQLLRLAVDGLRAFCHHKVSAAGALLYAGYAWSAFLVMVPFAWLLACLMPVPGWSWAVSSFFARIFLGAIRVRITLHNEQELVTKQQRIIVANHSSYLDSLVLVAALPTRYSFVAKKELAGSLFSRLYLNALECEFVDRFDFQQGVADHERLMDSVRSGKSMLFFPEGTFLRRPGLIPFKMGAFLIGAQTGVPVVPVTIKGTRDILHPEQWFPRRGGVTITVSPPLTDTETDWNAAIRLRDNARSEILRNLGEPDLLRTGS